MFNKEDYRHLKEEVLQRVRKEGVESITEFAVLTGIPLIVQYEFVLEDMPEHKEHCEFKIKELKEFMGY